MSKCQQVQLPEGFMWSGIFGFETLHEMSSRNDDVTRIRVFAINKDTGIPENYLIKCVDKDLADSAFMQRVRDDIKKTFIGVIDGDPK